MSEKRNRDSYEDCNTKCKQEKVYIPVVGPQGPPGIPGPGTIIPYASGDRFPIANLVGRSKVISTIGFGSHHEFSSVNDALQNSEDVFIVPRSGRVRSLYCSVFLDQNNIVDVFGVSAELWRSTNGNNFNQFPFPISATFTGAIGSSYLNGSINLIIPEPVSAGDNLILVITFEFGVLGETPRTVLMGYRAGVDIE